jgi:hypothetical protein
MLGRHKLLIIIPAIILIPILLGITPMNMIHKLGSGGPFTHTSHTKSNNHCPFNSLNSHEDLTVGTLNSILLDQQSLSSQEVHTPVLDFINSSIFFNPVPLRC